METDRYDETLQDLIDTKIQLKREIEKDKVY